MFLEINNLLFLQPHTAIFPRKYSAKALKDKFLGKKKSRVNIQKKIKTKG